MSGLVVVDGNVSQSAGATGRGGLLVVRGDASARCGISMKGIDIVVAGSVGHMSAFMAQTGRARRLRRRGRGARRLDLRGAAVRARRGREPRRRLRREGAAGRARGPAPWRCSRPRASTRTRPTSAATARRGSSTTSRSTTRARTDGRRVAALEPPRVVPLRPHDDRRDPARGARGDLRHPRLRREAPPAALRRPALPRRVDLALPARGLPRAVRDGRRPRDALREASRSS